MQRRRDENSTIWYERYAEYFTVRNIIYSRLYETYSIFLAFLIPAFDLQFNILIIQQFLSICGNSYYTRLQRRVGRRIIVKLSSANSIVSRKLVKSNKISNFSLILQMWKLSAFKYCRSIDVELVWLDIYGLSFGKKPIMQNY